MRITRHTDYGLRVLMYLSLHSGRVNIKDIAEAYNISRNHLMKVVHHLQLLGYVLTVRGKGGGITLNGKPEDILVGKVARDLESDIPLLECFSGQDCCKITEECQLKNAFAYAQDQFYDCLNQYSIARLVHGDKQIQELIQLTAVH